MFEESLHSLIAEHTNSSVVKQPFLKSVVARNKNYPGYLKKSLRVLCEVISTLHLFCA